MEKKLSIVGLTIVGYTELSTIISCYLPLEGFEWVYDIFQIKKNKRNSQSMASFYEAISKDKICYEAEGLGVMIGHKVVGVSFDFSQSTIGILLPDRAAIIISDDVPSEKRKKGVYIYAENGVLKVDPASIQISI